MEEKSQIKTGLFGGSFNPIHIGHLALANYLCEYGGLEEVWFLVTPQIRSSRTRRCLMTISDWKW